MTASASMIRSFLLYLFLWNTATTTTGSPMLLSVNAFSAQLPRPWDNPGGGNGGGRGHGSARHLRGRRRRRPQRRQDDENDDNTQDNDDIVLRMAIQKATIQASLLSSSSSSSSTAQTYQSPSDKNKNNIDHLDLHYQGSEKHQQHNEDHDMIFLDLDDLTLDSETLHHDLHHHYNSSASHTMTSTNSGTLAAGTDLSSSMLLNNINTTTNQMYTPLRMPNDQGKSYNHPTTTKNNNETIRGSLRYLYTMSRPSNYMGVIILHILGTLMGLRAIISTGNAGITTRHELNTLLWSSLLLRPQMMIVLMALVLTSATSMMVNDYYDAKSGVDDQKIVILSNQQKSNIVMNKNDKIIQTQYETRKPLISRMVSFTVVKRCLSYLYAILLLCITLVPGIMTRLSIMTGAMVTFWYTKHLKPMTWWKNIACAALIAFSPMTSALATTSLSVFQQQNNIKAVTAAAATTTSLLRSPLHHLIGMLFMGFMGREIMMDMTDIIPDEQHGIRTVPVTYGRVFAARTAFACTVAMSCLALWNAIVMTGTSAATAATVKATMGATSAVGMHVPASLYFLSHMLLRRRQVILASIGSLAQSIRAYQIVQTAGEDTDVIHQAIEEGKLSVLFLLASFV